MEFIELDRNWYVRFGVQDLGILGRDSGEEIGIYIGKLMTSEFSVNMIDICPVGALTAAVGSDIRIDSRGPEVMRITPRLAEVCQVFHRGELLGLRIRILGHGSGKEIGTYVEKLMRNEISGNVIDIYPVKALTSKRFAFKARNWKLKGTETIDVTDAFVLASELIV